MTCFSGSDVASAYRISFQNRQLSAILSAIHLPLQHILLSEYVQK